MDKRRAWGHLPLKMDTRPYLRRFTFLFFLHSVCFATASRFSRDYDCLHCIALLFLFLFLSFLVRNIGYEYWSTSARHVSLKRIHESVLERFVFQTWERLGGGKWFSCHKESGCIFICLQYRLSMARNTATSSCFFCVVLIFLTCFLSFSSQGALSSGF